MKVFVAGGGGAIGASLLPKLTDAGHAVVATANSAQGVVEIERRGASGALMDGLEEADVLEAVGRAQPDAIVHEMTALSGSPSLRHWDRWFALTNRLRTEGTANLLAAASRFRVRRFVAQGYTGWTNARSGGPLKSEADPLDPVPPREMRETMWAIRELERAVLDADLEGLVLRYGSLYGPGTAYATEYVELARDRKLPVIGDGAGVWSFIHVDDAADATVVAVERGEPGIYNIVDDDPARADWIPVLARRSGGEPPRHLPVWLGRLAIGEVGVSLMTRIRGSSNAKAKRELGWRPAHPSWRLALGPAEDETNVEAAR
jgi:nucleoside-diphosphate-sugar epimerase